MANALDHGSMVQAVAQDDAVGQFASQGSEGGIVGDIAGGEDEGSLFAVQVGQALFESDGMLVVTRDVSCTASTSTIHIQGLMHGLQDMLVAAHAEVVVGAPDGDLLLGGGHVCSRELFGHAVDVVEVTVRLVLVLLVQLVGVELLVVELGRFGDCGFGTSTSDLGVFNELFRLGGGHGSLLGAVHLSVDTGLLLGSGVQLLLEEGLDDARAGGGFAVASSIDLGALHSKALVHDRASSGIVLQLGDGAACWALVGGSAEGA